MPARRLAYLTLEAPREGQASYVHVNEMVHALEQLGWRVDLYQPGYHSSWQRPGIARRLLAYLTVQARLALRMHRIDALYVRSHFMALPAAILCRVFGKPIVQEVNGPYGDIFVTYPWLERMRALLERCQRWQYRSADGLIAVTEALGDWLGAQAPGVPVEVVPNGANVDLFSPERADDRALPERFVVFFGGLTRWHGVDWMIEAHAEAAWPDDVKLVLIGDGPEAGMVRRAGARDERIVWLGRLPYREVAGVVARAEAALVCITDPQGRSRTGVAPIKLYEALACGIPVIVSELPGQAELVREHDVGRVVPLADAGALASAVAELASDRARAKSMGARGRALICDRHSWTARGRQTDRFLARILQHEGASVLN